MFVPMQQKRGWAGTQRKPNPTSGCGEWRLLFAESWQSALTTDNTPLSTLPLPRHLAKAGADACNRIVESRLLRHLVATRQAQPKHQSSHTHTHSPAQAGSPSPPRTASRAPPYQCSPPGVCSPSDPAPGPGPGAGWSRTPCVPENSETNHPTLSACRPQQSVSVELPECC